MKLPWRSLLRLAACLGWFETLIFAVTHGAVQGVIGAATALSASLANFHAHLTLPDRWTLIGWAGVFCLYLCAAGSKLQRGPLARPLARPLAWLFGIGVVMAGWAFVVRLMQQRARAAAGV